MSFAMPPPRPKKPAKPALTISPVNSRPSSSSGSGAAQQQQQQQQVSRDQLNDGDGERTQRPLALKTERNSSRDASDPHSETMRIHQIQKVLAGFDISEETPPNSAGIPGGSSSSEATWNIGTDGPCSSGTTTRTTSISDQSRHTPLMARSSSSSSSLANKPSPGTAGTSHSDDEIAKILPADLKDVQRLGEGSAGEVYKVMHVPTGMLLARKTMATSPQPEIHRQILRELAFNRECRAPFIVKYYGAYLEESQHEIAILMEFCQGGSLDSIYKQIRRRNGRTGEKILGKVAEAVLDGLVYLHDRKIIHRDIKPSNILVSGDGQIKLCDFGVSGELINSMAKTFVGTSNYMAPERIQGAPYSWTSDIWSLGLTLAEIAMNRFPFPPEGEPPLGPIDLLTYIIRMDPPQLKDDEAAGIVYKKPIRDFLRLCLLKDAKQRPTPADLRTHPWIVKSKARDVDMARWLRQVWGWPEEEPQA